MKLARVKWEILDCLGYVFCETAFRWWDIFDDTQTQDYPSRKDMLVSLIGNPLYKTGCFFYSLQDYDAAGVTYTKVEDE